MAAADYNTLVQELYISYFGRPADTRGLLSFTQQLDALHAPTTTADLIASYKTSPALKSLIDSFGNSDESKALYPTNDTLAFVTAIYNNVLNRAPDFDGLLFWAGEIDAGRLTKSGAALSILDGALSNTSAQGVLDAKVVTNKAAIAANFTAAIDTGEELSAYVGNNAAAIARDMLSKVTSATDPTAFQATVTSTLVNMVNNAVPGQTIALTVNPDTVTGTAGSDVINATNLTYTGLDTIDGGKGFDTLNVSDVAGSLDLSLASVVNVEALKATSTGAIVNANTTAWTGLQTATFSVKSAAIQTVAVADTTAVNVSNSAGGVTVTGGSSATVTAAGNATAIAAVNALATAVAAAADAAAVGVLTTNAVSAGTITSAQKTTIDTAAGTSVAAAATATTAVATALTAASAVSVSGDALTTVSTKGGTSVTVSDTSDDSNVLTTVTVDGNSGAATLNGDAIANVTIANTAASTTINNTTTAHAETISVNNVTGGTITDAAAKTVTLTSVTKKSSGITLTAGEATAVTVNAGVDVTLAHANINKATALTLAGAGKVTLSALDAVAALTSINASTNSGGVTITPALGNGVAYTGSAGTDKISIGAAATKAIATGAGNDTVTITSNTLGTGGSVDAGAGTDTLAGTSALLSGLLAGAAAAKFTAFETIKVTDVLANAASFDVSALAGAVNFTAGNGVAAAGTATATNLGANANVAILGDAANTGTLKMVMKTDTAADTINLTVNHDYTNANASAHNAFTTTVDASNIETLNVTSTATDISGIDATDTADNVINTLAITDTALVTLKISGDQGAVFNTADAQTKLAMIDASANTAGVTISAAGTTTATNAALTIKGSATAANVLTGSANGDTLIGGAKADTITGGAGGDTLTGGGGNDTFVYATGNSSIGTGTFDTITDFSANTYGNGTSGAADKFAGTQSKWTGDVLAFSHAGTTLAANGFKVFVASNAADATTFLANTASASNTQASAALDASGNNLYVDVSGDGVADFYIHLTGVSTITTAAFTLA